MCNRNAGKLQFTRLLVAVAVNKLLPFIQLWPSDSEESNEAAKIHFSQIGLAEAGRPRPQASFQRRSRIAKGYHKRKDWCWRKQTCKPTKCGWKHLLLGSLRVRRSQCLCSGWTISNTQPQIWLPTFALTAANLFTRPGKLRTDSGGRRRRHARSSIRH